MRMRRGTTRHVMWERCLRERGGRNRKAVVGTFPNLTSTVCSGSIISTGEEGESQAALQLLLKLL